MLIINNTYFFVDTVAKSGSKNSVGEKPQENVRHDHNALKHQMSKSKQKKKMSNYVRNR